MQDPKSVAGKHGAPAEHAELLVIGAGPAGIAAAIAGARDGAKVVLIDENPVAGGLMGLDVPLFYGQRMTAAVHNKPRMVEQVLSAKPALEEALEAGVDVRLGVYAWGAFVNGPGVQTLPGRVVGLADDERSWLIGFDRLVVAAGARDFVVSFAGVEQPGVIGARALQSLIATYDAFDGRRIVILGSGDLAVETARQAQARGLEVACLVEVRDSAQSVTDLPVLTGHAVARAVGGPSGIEAVDLVGPGGAVTRIACDTICLAIGLVPVVELADVLGCRLAARGDSGGHVPLVDGEGRSSIPGVSFAGDCAGVPSGDGYGYRLDWVRAQTRAGDGRELVCLCEEVSRAELLGMQPPRYLGCPPPQGHDLSSMLADGPPSHDQMKRLTRVTMGHCQGRRCREQVALHLALASNLDPAEVPLAGYRAPVRPLPLTVLADADEEQVMRDRWEVWFGIPGQWTPYADIGTEREVLDDESGLGDHMHL